MPQDPAGDVADVPGQLGLFGGITPQELAREDIEQLRRNGTTWARRRGKLIVMKRITDRAQMRNWLTSRVNAAGQRATSRHTLYPLGTINQRAQLNTWTLNDLIQLAPYFGAKLVLEVPDDPAPDAPPRPSPFYKPAATVKPITSI